MKKIYRNNDTGEFYSRDELIDAVQDALREIAVDDYDSIYDYLAKVNEITDRLGSSHAEFFCDDSLLDAPGWEARVKELYSQYLEVESDYYNFDEYLEEKASRN